jgi:chromosome segregation ATPase
MPPQGRDPSGEQHAQLESQWPAAAASFMSNSSLQTTQPRPPGVTVSQNHEYDTRDKRVHARAAEQREMQGLHIALSACRKQKQDLEHALHETSQRLQQQLAHVMDERDTLKLRLETTQSLLKADHDTLEKRQDREERLEKSVQMRKELGEVAEMALGAARQRILDLERDLTCALSRARELETKGI